MKKNEKTYHERIKIYFEKVVIKGEKRIRITDILISDIKDLPLQYFSEEYFMCSKKASFDGATCILFGVNKLSKEIFEQTHLSGKEWVKEYGGVDIFPVRVGESFSNEKFEKMVQYMKKSGEALNRIMKEVRKTEETWTGYGSVEI